MTLKKKTKSPLRKILNEKCRERVKNKNGSFTIVSGKFREVKELFRDVFVRSLEGTRTEYKV